MKKPLDTSIKYDVQYIWKMIPKWVKVVLFISSIGYLFIVILYYLKNPLGPEMYVNGKTIRLLIAATPEEKQLGLGYRSNLPHDTGMLFTFDTKGTHGFWMKGMQFPLDFVWIEDRTIRDITENVPIPTVQDMHHVSPRVPVNLVLELNAGTVKKFGLKIGDVVQIGTE